MDIYTGWLDYGATGGGRTLVAYIGWAENPDRLREQASQVLGEFFGRGLEVAEGALENPVTSRCSRRGCSSSFVGWGAGQTSSATR